MQEGAATNKPSNPFFQARSKQAGGEGGGEAARPAALITFKWRPAIAPIHVTQTQSDQVTGDASPASTAAQVPAIPVPAAACVPPKRASLQRYGEMVAAAAAAGRATFRPTFAAASQPSLPPLPPLQSPGSAIDLTFSPDGATGGPSASLDAAAFPVQQRSATPGAGDGTVVETIELLDTPASAPQAQGAPLLLEQLASYLAAQQLAAASAAGGAADSADAAALQDLPSQGEVLAQLTALAQRYAEAATAAGDVSGSQLWSVKYQPASAGQVCGNAAGVAALRAFLADWKAGIEQQSASGAAAAGGSAPAGPSPKKARKRCDAQWQPLRAVVAASPCAACAVTLCAARTSRSLLANDGALA